MKVIESLLTFAVAGWVAAHYWSVMPASGPWAGFGHLPHWPSAAASVFPKPEPGSAGLIEIMVCTRRPRNYTTF